MSRLLVQVKRSTLPVLIVLCLAALTVSYAYAEGSLRPLATQIIGDPDAAVTGKLAVGTATPGNKALMVVGVIDFLGAGTIHNYFTQGAGNNMQINANVDETNAVGDATKSQWKLVMGSSLDWFSIRRSPVGATYNEDALLFIEGPTGKVGIATVDTINGAAISFPLYARLHVQTDTGNAVYGKTTAGTNSAFGVVGESSSMMYGGGVYGLALASSGDVWGVIGRSNSTNGRGVYGLGAASTGTNYGVYGLTNSTAGYGVYYVGGLAGTGAKSAIVETDDYGWRHLYAVESPQNWFEDFGQATLTAGEAIVPIEEIFSQTVNLDQDYHVFLTPRGGFCSLYVAETSSSSFTVRAVEEARCEITFDYRIIAPRLEYEDLRLKQAEDPEAVAASLALAPPELPSP